MKTIYRYQLSITDSPVISMPSGAQILSAPPDVRNSHGRTVEIWAVVDTDQAHEDREFRIIGTGNYLPDDCGRFIGTAVTHGDAAVWHIFEASRG